MYRSVLWVLLTVAIPVSLFAQAPSPASSDSIVSYFTGKQVVAKIDMPGTQKGIDLRFNKPVPMDWKESSSRIKQFGPAIRKGDVVRITAIVVKKDMIEFQLDGGGFGTFGDDTTTTVTAKPVEKSNYEKSLEQQIAQTDDDNKRRQLQRDLDHERSRRERENAANQRAAQVASQIKAQQVADNRTRGGSRFNLRWSKSIPENQLSPEAVMALLAEYIDFSSLQTGAPAPNAQNGTAPPAQNGAAAPSPSDQGGTPAASPTAQLQRGMKIEDVTSLLGQGRQLSESAGDNGLKTQVYEYLPGDRRVEVTYVEGLVVRFSITSR